MTARWKTAWATSMVFAGLVASRGAMANGRFPRAEHLVESPSDSNKLYLSATYGLLATSDRGRNWYHVCESAFSFQTMYTGDPVFMLTGNESLLVGVQSTVSLSTDGGCDWKQAFADTSMTTFTDFTVSPSGSRPILVAATMNQGMTSVTQLRESTDNGATWKMIGAPLPVAVLNTIDVDPTDPTHVYATGLADASGASTGANLVGVFLSSTDHGATWTKTNIPNTSLWANPYIAAVHPTDPKKVFVRTDGWKNRDEIETADDALLYSSDAGKTWTELIHPGAIDEQTPGAKLLGFALSPDGSTVLAGYGDPVDSSRLVEGSWFGVYKASLGDGYSFGADPMSPDPAMLAEPISCLTWTKTGIYACVTPQGESSLLLFARDATFTSRAAMTKLMTLNETRGTPLGCTGRAVSACNWRVDCANLDACAAGGSSTGAAGGSGSAGTGSTTSGGTDGGASAGAGGASGGPGGSADSKGCGFRTPQSTRTHFEPIYGLVGAALIGMRRRARRRAAEANRARLAGTRSDAPRS